MALGSTSEHTDAYLAHCERAWQAPKAVAGKTRHLRAMLAKMVGTLAANATAIRDQKAKQ